MITHKYLEFWLSLALIGFGSYMIYINYNLVWAGGTLVAGLLALWDSLFDVVWQTKEKGL